MTKETLNVALVGINTANWQGKDLDQVYRAKLEILATIKEMNEKKEEKKEEKKK